MDLKERSRRRQEKKAAQQRVLFKGLLLFLLLTFFTRPLVQQWSNYQQMAREISSMEEEIKQVDQETQTLKALYEQRDSLDFVEYMARDKLGMVKADELVVLDLEEPAGPGEELEEKEESFLQRWFQPKKKEGKLY